ncbi:MAG: hypothetical protein FWE34_03810 [Defluviitaleaceae bacterium]|nr:hypothetical protein [Defluviitaleaceae bacterium]
MNEFLRYLLEKQEHCIEESKKMTEEGREDEAIFEKVRANIYGIFTTFKTPDVAAKMIDVIPKAWHESLAKAIKNNDHEKEAEERIKIAVMEDIKAEFAEAKGDM